MWLQCHGSLAFTRGAPNEASEYAAEGTAYHDVSARVLKTPGTQCADHIGAKYKVGKFDFTVDAENVEYAQVYVDAIRRLPGKLFVEQDLPYHHLLGLPDTTYDDLPTAGGSGDAVVLDFDNKIVHSDDLKFGRGETVYAKDNPQLKLYGVAAASKFDWLGIDETWRVRTAIHQPRISHYDEWVYTVKELNEWMREEVSPAARVAYALYGRTIQMPQDDDTVLANLFPGEKPCRWCPKRGSCSKRSQWLAAAFPLVNVEERVRRRGELTDEELAAMFLSFDAIEDAILAFRAEALARALNGVTLPNLKLAEGKRGNRDLNYETEATWSPEILTEVYGEQVLSADRMAVSDVLYEALGNDAHKPTEFLSVAKLQPKLQKKYPLLWNALQGYITQGQGKPSLVRIEDPRPPLALSTPEFPIAPPA